MVEHKVKVQEKIISNNVYLSNEQEQELTDSLIQLVRTNRFRSAINLIRSNAGVDHKRYYNAGVVLQNLSNEYGDIGLLKDECILQKELERQQAKVVELLV